MMVMVVIIGSDHNDDGGDNEDSDGGDENYICLGCNRSDRRSSLDNVILKWSLGKWQMHAAKLRFLQFQIKK